MSSMTLAALFHPTAVETPGGGRIRDKNDPVPGDLVTVRGVNGPVQLHRLAGQAWAALVDAARAAGLREPLLLPVSGYRSRDLQARLYQQALRRYGTPERARRWVAPPGASAHQSGRAIDFHLGGRNESANAAALRQTPAYRWLAGHAEAFGFYPYQAEPWHWEYNPPGSPAAPAPTTGGVPGTSSELLDAVPALLRSVRGVAEGVAAFASGVRDASRLTDIAFYARHPERGGRAIAPGESQPAQEWLWIRDHLVRPLLSAIAPGPATSAAAGTGAAGTTQVALFLKQAREPDRYRLLIPILDRYRGDIPLEFLLGWTAVESAGRIDEVTPLPLDERGFFQVSRSESASLQLDHQRLTTDPDYSVQGGIRLVRYYAGLAQNRYPWAAPGSELFWRMVKLQHAMGSGLTRTLISSMQAAGVTLTWEAIKRYEVSDGPRLHRLLNPPKAADRGRFTRNVDRVFVLGRQLAAASGR